MKSSLCQRTNEKPGASGRAFQFKTGSGLSGVDLLLAPTQYQKSTDEQHQTTCG
jgi:hypothetical protein